MYIRGQLEQKSQIFLPIKWKHWMANPPLSSDADGIVGLFMRTQQPRIEDMAIKKSDTHPTTSILKCYIQNPDNQFLPCQCASSYWQSI